MEPIVLMFYYINVNGLSNQRAEELMYNISKYTKIKLENVKIIQQYFGVHNGDTRVEVVTIPNLNVSDDDIARRINSNISKLVEQFEQFTPIRNIDDLYG